MPEPRKTTPRKRPSAAAAARREVKKEPESKPVVITVPYRGEKFEVTLDRLAMEKIYWRQKMLTQFGDAEDICGLLFDILGPVDSRRWINVQGPGDSLFQSADDFIKAMNKAGNDPNS